MFLQILLVHWKLPLFYCLLFHPEHVQIMNLNTSLLLISSIFLCDTICKIDRKLSNLALHKDNLFEQKYMSTKRKYKSEDWKWIKKPIKIKIKLLLLYASLSPLSTVALAIPFIFLLVLLLYDILNSIFNLLWLLPKSKSNIMKLFFLIMTIIMTRKILNLHTRRSIFCGILFYEVNNYF